MRQHIPERDGSLVLLRAAGRVAVWVRLRRSAYYGIRALTWGLALAVLPLAGKALLGAPAILLAIVLVCFCVAVGIASALFRKVFPADALRLADRALALEDRLATALECMELRAGSPVVQALVNDAVGKAPAVKGRRIVSWRWPREIRLLPFPAAAALALLVLPPLPLQTLGIFSFGRSDTGSRAEARPQPIEQMLQDQEKKNGRPEITPQYRDTSYQPPERGDAKNLPPLFTDTAVDKGDLGEFLRLGNDRLKILERPDRLPDFRSDFTPGSKRALAREMQSLSQGPSDQLSSARLRQLLEELERLGRKSDEAYQDDLMEGDEALEEGQFGRALSAMQRALNWLRSRDEGARAKKTLQRAREDGQSDIDDGSEDGDQTGKGSMPGQGRAPLLKGKPTRRLGGPKVDLALEGQSGHGRREAFAARMPERLSSRKAELPYDAGLLARYRRAMEETLAKETIPFEHRTQIRHYFQSLGEP